MEGMRLVYVYDCAALKTYIEKNRKDIYAVICGEGDEFIDSYEVVYRKDIGYVKELSDPLIRICGRRISFRHPLWAAVLKEDNSVAAYGITREEYWTQEQLIEETDVFLSYALKKR